ncbi:MAG: hypothetical protein Q9207_003504 [Kuettlingeria erythrocarpa]
MKCDPQEPTRPDSPVISAHASYPETARTEVALEKEQEPPYGLKPELLYEKLPQPSVVPIEEKQQDPTPKNEQEPIWGKQQEADSEDQQGPGPPSQQGQSGYSEDDAGEKAHVAARDLELKLAAEIIDKVAGLGRDLNSLV